MKPKRLVKYALIISAVASVTWFIPYAGYVISFFLICGLLDLSRNTPITPLVVKRYFLGNGLLTFFLSPINLLIDLLCHKNHKVYALEDYPETHQKELRELLMLFDNHKDKIKNYIDDSMEKEGRSMIFFKWYGRDYNALVPEFNKEFKYIQTVGVSSFKPNNKTSWHYGPIRINLRVLYNLFPGPDAFIETQGKKYHWSDSSYFSFDDTLFHRSVNDSDQVRYCAFIDIERPSRISSALKVINSIVNKIFHYNRGVFYKNWKLIR